jgi:hypothetical protein
VKRPDLHDIMMNSYACGLERHHKNVRALIEYIEHLEGQVAALSAAQQKGDTGDIRNR